MMDSTECEDKRDTGKKEKYPKSVLKVSEVLRQARKSTPPEMVQCKDSLDDNVFYQTSTNTYTTPPSSSSSGSSTPTGSPYSSVSCNHHSCGSLFAKCSEHGRWPLLQTFTNRESPLSQQTFSNRYPHKRSCSLTYNARVMRNNDSTKSQLYQTLLLAGWRRQPAKTILRISDGRSRREKKLNKVKFLGDSKDTNKTHQLKIIRRHNSLPDGRTALDGKTLSELNKIFNDSIVLSNNDCQNTICGTSDESNKQKRERSKSEDKLNKWTNDFNDYKGKRNFEVSHDTLNWCDKYHKKCLKSDRNLDLEKENHTCRTEKFDSSHVINCFHNDFCKAHDTECFRSVFSKLQKEAKQWEHKIDFLETEILLLRRELKKRDQENVKLQQEVHKLRSVLEETSIFKQEGDLLSSLQDSHGMPGQVQHAINIPNPNKKQGVSGESSDHGRNHNQIEIQRFDKDFRSKQLIKDALLENDFLKNLDTSQVREIVESVYPMEFSKGDYVVREGEAGSHLYVSAEGELEVIKDHKVLGRMGPGKAFGELAILYNCKRTASIKVVSDAKVWVLDRRVFQKIMMKTGLQRLQENLNFLRSVPLLQSLSNEVLAKIADVLEVDFYPSGEHIIRQGASGDTFFIISSGSVKVTQNKPGRQEEEEIRILNKGDYFGEQALLKEDWRTANVIALSPGVECLTLDRDSFIQLIGDLSELQEKDYGDQVRSFSRPSSSSSLSDKQEYDYIRLEDLDIVSTLGVGGFGRVELVQYSKNKNMTFALKCLKKQHIIETKQQEHVYSERNIMMACNSPFICRLYKTFRDSKYVYMLQEALLGGEVWTILREKGYFDSYTTKFITGCVVEAFEYLHARGIIYRDLKPENLLLDNMGYAKLVDFGFSKRLGFSSKTWTFCGTPEYLAPEIILNKGHDRAVDYWSLGVFMHELLTGIPPFTASDPMKTYNMILKGIDMIDFPRHITRAAQSLIKRLCRDAPSERLGYQRGGIQDIKKHKWFQGFDWSGLKQRALSPPITPQIRSPTDTSNFDYYSKETSVPTDEFSNWDAEF